MQVTTYGQHSFAPNVKLTGFSAKYETVFRPKQNAKVLLDVAACGHYEVYLNGEKSQRRAIGVLQNPASSLRARKVRSIR